MFGLELVFAAVVGGMVGKAVEEGAKSIAGDAAKKLAGALADGVVARTAGHFGLPENHDAQRAIRRAQLQSMRSFLSAYRARHHPQWLGCDYGSAEFFVQRGQDFVDEQIGLCVRLSLKMNDAVVREIEAALNSGLGTAVVAAGLKDSAHQSLVGRAADLREAAETAVLQEFGEALANAEPTIVAPHHFERALRGLEPGVTGWFDGFVLAIGEELKKGGKVAEIFAATRLGGLAEIGAKTLSLVGGLTRSAEAIRAQLDQMERQQREADQVTHAMLRAIQERLPDPSAIRIEALRPIVEALQIAHVPQGEWQERVLQAVQGLLAKQSEPVVPSNQGADVDAMIRQARAVAPDAERAVSILREGRAHLRDERLARQRAEAALLKEEADFLSLTYRHNEALKALEEAASLQPDDPWLWFGQGDIHRLLGATSSALDDFREGGRVARRIGDNRSVSASFDRVGDVQFAQGALRTALQSFRDALAIVRRLGASSPQNRDRQRDLSVCLTKIGDVQDALGNLTNAHKHHREALTIRKRLAESDLSNHVWQRDLSISLINLGDMQFRQGDLLGARMSFEDALVINEKLVEKRPEEFSWRRDILVCLNRIGDVQAANDDPQAALKSYVNALAIARQLVTLDTTNIHWQRDLSVSLANVGDAKACTGDLVGALASLDEDLDIAKRLAASDPANAASRRDLSVSFEKVGNVLLEQGIFAEALKNYQKSLEIRQDLVQFEPDNTIWRRDLSVSLIKVGEIQAANGERGGALENFRDAHVIRLTLASSDRRNAGWQRDLIISYIKIASMDENACQNWTAAHAIAKELRKEGRLAPSDLWLVEETGRKRSLACV